MDQDKRIRLFLNKDRIDKTILKTAKKEKQIVYGARSIQAQIGIFSRDTMDYDIFSSNPKRSANRIQKKLDKSVGFDYFYTQPGMHKGTWKVKSRGYDLKKGTRDDEGIVDYTLMPRPRPSIKKINGVLYRKLSEEKRAKKKAIRDPNYAFRKEKDSEDLMRINLSRSPF